MSIRSRFVRLIRRFGLLDDPAHRFNAWAAERGGFVSDAQAGGWRRFMATVCDESLRRARDVRTGAELVGAICDRIQIHFLDNWDPNAAAHIVGEESRLVFFSGCATTVMAIACAAMRSAEVWAELPGGSGHHEAFAPLVATLADRRGYHADPATVGFDPDSLYREPDDESRRETVELLAAAVWRFLFLHELQHVFRGHLDLVRKDLGWMALLEAGGASVTTDVGADLRALELDADRCAATLLADDADWGDPGAARRVLRVQIVALGVVFELLDWESLPIEASRLRSHPHPAVRMSAAVEALLAAHADRPGYSPDSVGEVVERALADLVRIGEPLEWTLMQVLTRETARIEREIAEADARFDPDRRFRAVRWMLRRKRIDVVGLARQEGRASGRG